MGITFNKVKPAIFATETLLPPDKAVFHHHFRLAGFAYRHTSIPGILLGKHIINLSKSKYSQKFRV
jgi:hypothetical protein